ncbi:oligosaccharide flippase family protein [Mycoplasmatota bacterium]|nr:oligosaccharide flippase family protein [Mycoplasmatota bacterium]
MILKNKKVQQYGLLTVANFGTMFFAFITNILMTSLLTENDYGTYRYIINTIIMIVSFSNLGIYYSTARLLTNANKERERDLYGATIAMMFFISVFVAVVIFVVYKIITCFFHNIDPTFLYALPLIYTVMIQRTFIYMLKGSNKIFDVSLQTILPQILMLTIYSFVFIINFKHMNFLTSLCIYACVFIITDFITIARLRIRFLTGIKKETKNIYSEQKRNGFEIYKGSLLAVFSADALNVIIGSITMKAHYAVYTLALSFSSPILQIPAIMGVIQFKKYANTNKLDKKEIGITVIIGLLAYLGLNIIMLMFFPIVYKDRYLGTPSFVLALSLGYLFHGFGDYFNNFLNAHGEGSSIKKGAYFSGITQIVLAALLVPYLELWGLAISRITASFVYFIIMLQRYHRVSRKTSKVGED